MKLVAFADTHNRPQRMLDVVAREEEDLSACFFLGDGTRDAEKLQTCFPHLPLYVAQGNCDFGGFEPYEGLAPFGGLLFFYTHGHNLGVKESLDALWWRAHDSGADAALFAHTHVPHYEFRNGIHLFNPGSLTMPRGAPPSYGRIVIDDGVPTFSICRYEKE